MRQVIVFANEYGNVSVVTPTGEIPIEAVLRKDAPPGAIIINESELPQSDASFFNAWELIDGKVVVNISKAQFITRNRLRFLRAPLIAKQDVAFQMALETGVGMNAVIEEKQRLRDITKAVENITDLDELLKLMP